MTIGNERDVFYLPDCELPFSCRFLYPEGTPKAILHIIPGLSTPLSYWFGTDSACRKEDILADDGNVAENTEKQNEQIPESSDESVSVPCRDVIRSLTERGVIVCGFDPQGIGETVSENIPLGRIAEHGKQVEAIRTFYEKVRKTYRHLPYIMMGYGIGSLALREYITCYDDLDGAAICGTITGDHPLSTLRLFSYCQKLLQAKVNRLLNGKYAPEQDKFSFFSADEKERLTPARLIGAEPKLHKSGYLSLFRQIEKVNTVDMADKIPLSLPTFIGSGEGDPLSFFGYETNKLAEYLTDREMNMLICHIYKGSRHAIDDRTDAEFTRDLCKFVEEVSAGVVACRTYGNYPIKSAKEDMA